MPCTTSSRERFTSPLDSAYRRSWNWLISPARAARASSPAALSPSKPGVERGSRSARMNPSSTRSASAKLDGSGTPLSDASVASSPATLDFLPFLAFLSFLPLLIPASCQCRSERARATEVVCPTRGHEPASGTRPRVRVPGQGGQSTDRPVVLLAVAAGQHLGGEQLAQGQAAREERDVGVVEAVGEDDQPQRDRLVRDGPDVGPPDRGDAVEERAVATRDGPARGVGSRRRSGRARRPHGRRPRAPRPRWTARGLSTLSRWR